MRAEAPDPNMTSHNMCKQRQCLDNCQPEAVPRFVHKMQASNPSLLLLPAQTVMHDPYISLLSQHKRRAYCMRLPPPLMRSDNNRQP